MAYRYRYTNVPSLIQGDMVEDEAICFVCKRQIPVDFHHVLNGSEKKASEQIGAWVWLCRRCHESVHKNADKKRWLKALCQEAYEKDHSRKEWMKLAHKNYL